MSGHTCACKSNVGEGELVMEGAVGKTCGCKTSQSKKLAAMDSFQIVNNFQVEYSHHDEGHTCACGGSCGCN